MMVKDLALLNADVHHTILATTQLVVFRGYSWLHHRPFLYDI
jgi:hypothetical protein